LLKGVFTSGCLSYLLSATCPTELQRSGFRYLPYALMTLYVVRCTWYDIASMRNIIPILKSLGLLESEVKTYIAALELGPSSVLDLNKKIGLSRQAIYTAIESLIELGLMSSVEKGKKTLFAAESPERLRSFAEAKLKKMEATVREIKDISKDLALIQQGEKPVVKMFEGKEGQKSILEDVIKTKPGHIYDFVNDDAYDKLFTPEELQPYKDQLDKLNIQTRVMAIRSQPLSFYRKNVKGKQITRKDIKFNGNVTVYGNKVALSSLGNKMVGAIIESKDIAETVRCLMQLAWDSKLE